MIGPPGEGTTPTARLGGGSCVQNFLQKWSRHLLVWRARRGALSWRKRPPAPSPPTPPPGAAAESRASGGRRARGPSTRIECLRSSRTTGSALARASAMKRAWRGLRAASSAPVETRQGQVTSPSRGHLGGCVDPEDARDGRGRRLPRRGRGAASRLDGGLRSNENGGSERDRRLVERI